MHINSGSAWEEGMVPGDWTNAIIILYYKGSRNECEY